MKNKLSIIVPVYNDEKNLGRSLDSLLRQKQEVNVIIVDDGSTDSSGKIGDDYASRYDNVSCFHKVNGGISDARNYGLSKVESEFFGFLDSDDEVKEDMSIRMLEEIEKTNSDICFSNFMWVYEDGSTRLGQDVGYQNKHEILEKMYATLWNKIYRTSWFKNTGLSFPTGLRYEDASVLYRLALHMDKVCYVEDSFVNYYQRKGSITHTFNIQINDMIKVFEGINDYYADHPEYKPEIEYLFIRFFLGNSYLRACRIEDKEVRKDTLDKGWACLMRNYPDFKKNKYLKNSGLKNKYFSLINKGSYYFNSNIFRILYKTGLMKQ